MAAGNGKAPERKNSPTAITPLQPTPGATGFVGPRLSNGSPTPPDAFWSGKPSDGQETEEPAKTSASEGLDGFNRSSVKTVPTTR